MHEHEYKFIFSSLYVSNTVLCNVQFVLRIPFTIKTLLSRPHQTIQAILCNYSGLHFKIEGPYN